MIKMVLPLLGCVADNESPLSSVVTLISNGGEQSGKNMEVIKLSLFTKFSKIIIVIHC